MRVLGILLVIFGVALLIWGGITVFIPQDSMNMGPLSIHVNENLTIPLPPIVGLICLLIGIVMILSEPAAVGPPPPY